MKRKSMISFFVLPLLLIMADISMARVNVDINIGLPPVFRFSVPPELVVIPNTYVYYPPAADIDIVFYGGFWWRPYNGYWYRSTSYNGPWRHMHANRVPRHIIDLPPKYRGIYRDYPRIPHRNVYDNWRRWEKERYWHKREWKHERNEWQHERREDRREHRQDMREQRHERRKDRPNHR